MADEISADDILDCALSLADRSSWEALRLHQVAQRLGVGLDTLQRHFAEKEDLVDAWFDRADTVMLRTAADLDLALSLDDRLHRVMMAWLDALAPHRSATRQMISGKLEFGHVHFQVAGLLRISRTVQWMREAAGCESTLPRRAIEEASLTSVYLVTFAYWMFDRSANSQGTRDLLRRKLRLLSRLPCTRPT